MGLHRTLVDAAGELVEDPPLLAEAADQVVELDGAEVGDGRHLHLGERPLGRRTDAVDPPHRQRIEEGLHLLGAHDGEAVGLVEVGGDLGDQPVGPDADAHRQPPLLAHPPPDLLRHRRRAPRLAQVVADVEVGFVDRHRLHQGGELVVDGEDLLRLARVAAEVGRDEDGVRAEPAGARGGHRRMDAEAADLVAGGRHHPPALGPAADHHRLAAQRRIVAHVNRRVEAVHVAMEDTPHAA